MTDPAPLVATPDAPVPPGGGAEWFTGAGAARLRAALFAPSGPVRGTVVLSTGRTEPIEKYFEVIGELNGRGFVVLAQEWRGQGLSHRDLPDRLKGHAYGYETYLADFSALLATFESRLPKPWIAVGHSMGGCLTLLALAKGQAARFAGAVLCAPMLGLNTGGLPLVMGRLMAGVNGLIGRGNRYFMDNPGAPFDETFETNVLTHDPVRYRRARAQVMANHDLALGGPTWGWIDFAMRATSYLAKAGNLAPVKIPVIIVSAAEDRLVTDDAQRVAATHLPDGRFVSVAGAYHEVLMETDDKRAQFWVEFDGLADRVAPPVAGKAKVTKPKVTKPKVVKPKAEAPVAAKAPAKPRAPRKTAPKA